MQMSSDDIQIILEEKAQLEREKIQWMVVGPDYPKFDSIRDMEDADFSLQYPKKDDCFEISLLYPYENCNFIQSLFMLRSKIKYWCDITRANKLMIRLVFEDSHRNVHVQRLGVDLNGRNVLLDKMRVLGGEEVVFGMILEDEGLFGMLGDVSIRLYNDNKVSRDYKDLHQELIRCTWHPDRFIDWCYDEDQKKSLYESIE